MGFYHFYHQMVGFPVNPKNHLQFSFGVLKKLGWPPLNTPEKMRKSVQPGCRGGVFVNLQVFNWVWVKIRYPKIMDG